MQAVIKQYQAFSFCSKLIIQWLKDDKGQDNGDLKAGLYCLTRSFCFHAKQCMHFATRTKASKINFPSITIANNLKTKTSVIKLIFR